MSYNVVTEQSACGSCWSGDSYSQEVMARLSVGETSAGRCSEFEGCVVKICLLLRPDLEGTMHSSMTEWRFIVLDIFAMIDNA